MNTKIQYYSGKQIKPLIKKFYKKNLKNKTVLKQEEVYENRLKLELILLREGTLMFGVEEFYNLEWLLHQNMRNHDFYTKYLIYSWNKKLPKGYKENLKCDCYD